MTVLGDVAMDWLVRLDRLPGSGERVAARAIERSHGGSGANVAVGLRRLGVPVRLKTKVGDDEAGRALLAGLAGEGLDVSGVVVDPAVGTPVVLALIEGGGDRTLISCVLGSAQGCIEAREVGPLDADARWLHVSGILLDEEVSRQTSLQMMRAAVERGVMVSLDVNAFATTATEPGRLDAVRTAAQLADVVFASEAEALDLCGSSQDVQAWAASIKGTLVLRSGENGAVALGKAGLQSKPPPARILDALGAGDSFDAGYVAASVSGHDAGEALRWGNAAASVSVTRSGARSSPDSEELRAALERTPPVEKMAMDRP